MLQLRFALRKIRRQRFTSLINISGLTLGILSCLLLYLITRYELSFDKFHPNQDRLFRVVLNIDNPTTGHWYRTQVSSAAANEIKQHFTGIEQMATFYSYSAKISVSDSTGAVHLFSPNPSSETIIPESAYFSLFSYRWLYGSPGTSLRNPFQLVLTSSRARELFGALPLTEIMGKEVVYDDSLRLRVSGIVEDWKNASDLHFREFISYPTIEASFLSKMGDMQFAGHPEWSMPDYTQNFVRLSPGSRVEQFERQTTKMVKGHMTNPGDPSKIRMTLQPLKTIHFDSRYRDFYSRQADLSALYLLMGIAGFIVAIAIFNFVNLATAQNMQRAKEIGIKKILGSGRMALIGQLLLETMFLSLVASVLALLATKPALELFRDWMPQGLQFSFTDPLPYLFLIIVTILVTLLAGLYPAVLLAGTTPVQSLIGRNRQPRQLVLQRGLIVLQFSLASLFISGTFITGAQTHYLLNKPLGFDQSAIISLPTSDNYPTSQRNLLADRLRNVAGVADVSACWGAPMINYNKSEESYLQRSDRSGAVACSERVGDEHYLSLFGIKLLAGRNIAAPRDDTADFVPSRVGYGYVFPKKHTEIIINETCARALGFNRPEDALGHLVRTPSPDPSGVTGPIVGVMADFHAQTLFSPIRPVYFYGSRNLWRGSIQLKIAGDNLSPGGISHTLDNAEKAWKSVFPQEDFTYWFLDASVQEMYRQQRQMTEISTAAMIVAIFISCLGLLALAIHSAGQRAKEIGIRKVLGARVAGIMLLLSGDFLRLIGISLLIATPVAWYFSNSWLQNFAFHIVLHWWIFALAGLATILVAMITVAFETYKAATQNPVERLHSQ